jgi:alkylation response protein AidB-like acyl-CoA dehydrogenase
VDDPDQLGTQTRSWLDENWDPDLTMREWWRRLAEAGYSAPQWPREWGGLGASGGQAAVIRSALSEARLPGPPAGIGIMLAGPTILAHGTAEQKARYLPGIITGETNWCQLFSEPQAGSDLAGLRTSARRNGSGWQVNGQKVWTSNAHLADMGMLLARTDIDAPKHRGITWFALDMNQSGIEVRPLREMTGRSLFNEVFITDAAVAHDAVVGEVNGGWPVAKTTLAAERSALSSGGQAVGGVPGRRGVLEQRAGDIAERLGRPRKTSGTAMAMRGRMYDALYDLAAERDRLSDYAIRRGLVDLYTREKIIALTARRAQDSRAKKRATGAEGSIGKLMASAAVRTARDVGLQILGADGMLAGADAPRGGVFQEMALFSPAVSIYGGSDEIQRNILAERVLRLPRDAQNGGTT